MAGLRNALAGLLGQLRRRGVFTATAGYAIVAWILLQIAEVTFEPLHLPDWALTGLVVAAIAGFPVVVVVSWFFDIGRHGISRDAADMTGSTDDQAARPIPDRNSGATRPSVAVLAFEDMSPRKDQEYFCDGIAEEILNRLTRIQLLRVASRTWSFLFKRHPADIGSIGRELNVDTVLEGSVRKSGERVRIATQLVNAANGYQLWSHSFDAVNEDIFRIQEEIATQVADALKVTLTGNPKLGMTRNARAYEHYLKGMHYFHRWGLRNVQFAIENFGRAVQRDPEFAVAWAALADCHAAVCMYWDVSDAHLEAAEHASETALAIAPNLAEAHVSRGLAHSVSKRGGEAIAEFETAVELNPQLFEAWYFYGRILFQSGDLPGACRLFERAEQVRPDDFQSPILLRQIYESLGRHDDAERAARRGVERARRQLELNPDDTRALNLGLGGLAFIGDRETLMAWAERSLAIDGNNADTLYNVACGYAQVGETERALECLERAGLEGMLIAGWAENDSDLASLHNDPRFVELIARLKAIAPPKS